MDNLQTGDILLFSPNTNNIFFKLLDYGIRQFTQSQYTHVAFVLKDPTFIHSNLKGLYINQLAFIENQNGTRKDI